WNAKQRGFDLIKGYVAYQGKGKIKNWIIGDYALTCGQGLLMGIGGGFGANTWVARGFTPSKAKPDRSSEENLSLRGIYLAGVLKSWQWSVYGSTRRTDGRLSDSGIVSTGTGLHRSES